MKSKLFKHIFTPQSPNPNRIFILRFSRDYVLIKLFSVKETYNFKIAVIY